MHATMRRKATRNARLQTMAALLLLLAAAGAHAQELFPLEPPPGTLQMPGGSPFAQDFQVAVRLDPGSQAPGSDVVAVMEFLCPERWYIYADTVSVALATAEGAAIPVVRGALHLPEKKTKYDEVLGEQVEYFEGQFEARLVLHVQQDAPEGEHTIRLKAGYQGCKPGLCFAPATRELEARLSVLERDAEPVAVLQLPAGYEEEFAQRSLAVAVLIAFSVGLGLAFTPCVYPMIPVTMAVIGATTTDRKLGALLRSMVYVFGISVTYAVLGLIAASAGEAFGTLLQSPILYIGLAVVFLVLAAAMFDLFTIQMPASWMARLQGKVRGRWGLIGIFVLGLLSGVAVTPCVAPVVSGAMAYVFKSRNLLAGFLILFAIAWGMGTPLVVLGTFSGLLKALPKSGKWQQTVKYVFGALLVAAAGYFVLKSGVLPGSQDRLPGNWGDSEQIALQQAQQENRPVMLYFWQERCPACDELKAKTFTDQQVLAEEERFVCAKVDGTLWDSETRRAMREKYAVWGFPTVAFINSDGDVVRSARLEGFKGPDEFLKAMRSVQ